MIVHLKDEPNPDTGALQARETMTPPPCSRGTNGLQFSNGTHIMDLLVVSHQISNEALDTIFRTRIFCVKSRDALKAVGGISPSLLPELRHLRWEVHRVVDGSIEYPSKVMTDLLSSRELRTLPNLATMVVEFVYLPWWCVKSNTPCKEFTEEIDASSVLPRLKRGKVVVKVRSSGHVHALEKNPYEAFLRWAAQEITLLRCVLAGENPIEGMV